MFFVVNKQQSTLSELTILTTPRRWYCQPQGGSYSLGVACNPWQPHATGKEKLLLPIMVQSSWVNN